MSGGTAVIPRITKLGFRQGDAAHMARLEMAARVSMPAFATLVAYDGARFSGFQRQSADKGSDSPGSARGGAGTVDGSSDGGDGGAGRTDSGVHATGQVIGFMNAAEFTPATWRRALNALLPEDVAIRAVGAVGDDFHARRSALSRRYSYRSCVIRFGRRSWTEQCLATGGAASDVKAMNQAAQSVAWRA